MCPSAQVKPKNPNFKFQETTGCFPTKTVCLNRAQRGVCLHRETDIKVISYGYDMLV